MFAAARIARAVAPLSPASGVADMKRSVVFTEQFKFSPDGTTVQEYLPDPVPQEVTLRCAEIALELGVAVDPADVADVSRNEEALEALRRDHAELLQAYEKRSAEVAEANSIIVQLRGLGEELEARVEALLAEVTQLRPKAAPAEMAVPGSSENGISTTGEGTAGAKPRKPGSR